jgi:hypothetical protein
MVPTKHCAEFVPFIQPNSWMWIETTLPYPSTIQPNSFIQLKNWMWIETIRIVDWWMIDPNFHPA